MSGSFPNHSVWWPAVHIMLWKGSILSHRLEHAKLATGPHFFLAGRSTPPGFRMPRKHNSGLITPNYPTEIELWVVEQELRARLTAIQTSLTPTERARPIQIQLSPISFLPNEILIHIFRLGLYEVPHSANALPLTVAVAGVCRSWRAVALCTPQLWTRVFVTSAMPVDLFQAYLERSRNFEIYASFCHWPVLKRANEVNSSEAFLELIVSRLRRHAYRLRSLSLWDVSDTVVCTVMRGLLHLKTPRLTSVSIKANSTTYTHYYQLRNYYLLSFLSGGAPLLTHLEVHHFPIETFQMTSNWPFNSRNLVSITLRTEERLNPPYLIGMAALCALLRSTPNLASLALYGPVVEPDEGFPVRSQQVILPSLKTLVIRRRFPGIRYHRELLSVLVLPALKHLKIPWHDDFTIEHPHVDLAATYLLDTDGQPRFASVRALYLHDSAVRWMMPTRTLMRAFPNVREVILGGADVPKFAATLRGLVVPQAEPAAGVRGVRTDPRTGCEQGLEGTLAKGAWERVRKVVLKEPDMAGWKGWMRGFCKWLAADGHSAGPVRVEIRNAVLRDEEVQAFWRSVERLGRFARVAVT